MAHHEGQWKKGQSGNPAGRPKMTEEDRVVKKMTRETWNDLSQKMMTCSQQDLIDLLNGSEKLPFEAEIFIRHMLNLGEKPDWHAYEKYLARRIGPVKQEIDINTVPKPVVIERQDGTEVVLGTKGGEENED